MREPTMEDVIAAGRQKEAPNNIEAEQALLGAILINNSAMGRVSRFLEGKHFYEAIHRRIYEVAFELIAAGKLANPVTMKTFLPKDTIGELTVPQYLARLASESVTVINARDYGEAIHEMWLARQVAAAGEDLVKAMYDLPPGSRVMEVAAPIRTKLAQLDGEALDDARSSRKRIGQMHKEEMREAKTNKVVRGVPVCLPEISRVLSEPVLSPGNLYGLLSSSGEGKTSLTVQQIYHALAAGNPVQFQSYDQTPQQIVRQMVAQQLEIEVRRQTMGDLSEREFERSDKFDDWIDQLCDRGQFEIVQCSNDRAAQLVEKASKFVTDYRRRRRKDDSDLDKVPLIVTDHIGSIEPIPEDSRSDPGTKAKGINKVL
jgi:replicative DNA helicase